MTTPLDDNQRSTPRFDRLGRSRRWMLVGSGVFLALALLVVLFNIEWSPTPKPPPGDRALDDEIGAFQPPTALDTSTTNLPRDHSPRSTNVQLPAGARVKVLGEDDGVERLIQEYEAARIEPRGEGRIHLVDPRAWLYMSEDQTVTMTGDEGLAFRRSTDGMLERGDVTGNVVVRLYRTTDSGSLDPSIHTPDMVIHTNYATFDNVRGEINCPGWVHVQTQEMVFEGKSLTALYNPVDGLQRLVVEQSLAPIRIAHAAIETPGSRERGGSDAGVPPTGTSSSPPLHTPGVDHPGAPMMHEVTPRSGEQARSKRFPLSGVNAVVRTRGRTFSHALRDQDAPPADLAGQGHTRRVDTQDGDETDAPPRRSEAQRERRQQIRRERLDERAAIDATSFYRARFTRNVRIWREGMQEVITGDELLVTFSFETAQQPPSSAGARSVTPAHPLPGGRFHTASRAGASLDARATLVLMAISALQQDDGAIEPRTVSQMIVPPVAEGDIYVSYEGPLIVTPGRDVAPSMLATDDVKLEIHGAPVTIDDPGQAVHAECARVEYHTTNEVLSLHQSDATPLTITNPDLIARGKRFNWHLRERRGAFVDRGAMTLFRSKATTTRDNLDVTHETPSAMDQAEQDARTAQDTSPLKGNIDEAAGGEHDASTDTPPTPPADATQGARVSRLEIEWSSGVEFIFANAASEERSESEADASPLTGSSGRLEKAIFRGDVLVREERFFLQSDSIEVTFETSAATRDAIRQIIADGSVRIRGLDDRGGYMEGRFVQLDFEPDEHGDMTPKKLTSRGDVLIRENEQEIRSRMLVANLVQSPDPPDGSDTTPTNAGTFDRVQIENFLATESVSVKLPNGATATGDRLEGNGIEQTAVLTGEQVVVDGAQEDVTFRSVGTSAVIERVSGDRHRITMQGSGRATINPSRPPTSTTDTPDVAPSTDDPSNPPSNMQPPSSDAETDTGTRTSPDEDASDSSESTPSTPGTDPEQIDVTWKDSFAYTEGRVAGAGTIDLKGDVNARSIAPREENTLRGLHVTFSFAESQTGRVMDNAGIATSTTEKKLQALTARGNVLLESRTWDSPERRGKPRFVHLTGQYVQYNQQTLEADVRGAGELLIHDPRAAKADAPEAELTGRGTTLFTWTRNMQMRELLDQQYTVTMNGDVEMLHQSSRGEAQNATLTAEITEVTLSRRDADEQSGGLDFGGSTEVTRLDAVGDGFQLVNLNAQGKNIVCDRLIYNENAQIAEIIGTDRVPAEVRTENAIAPVRATRMVWNLQTDAVRVSQLRSTLPRRPGGN